MGRILFAALLAAVVMFAWGFVFWALLAEKYEVIGRIPAEDAFLTHLRENVPHSGVYVFPAMPDPTAPADELAQTTFEVQHKEGPLGRLFLNTEGAVPMEPKVFAQGFLHFFAAAALAGLLLRVAAPNLKSYLGRLLFVICLGIFLAVTMGPRGPIWFYEPWRYAIAVMLSDVIAWSLAGLVLAYFVIPPQAEPPPPLDVEF